MLLLRHCHDCDSVYIEYTIVISSRGILGIIFHFWMLEEDFLAQRAKISVLKRSGIFRQLTRVVGWRLKLIKFLLV